MIGEKLKRLRGKVSQEEVAKKLDISRARLSHYETGRSDPDLEMLKKFADFYSVSVDFLLDRKEISHTELSTEDREMIKFFNDPNLNLFFKEMKEAPEEQLEEMRQIWEVIKKRGLNK